MPRQFEVVSGQGRIKVFGHAIADKFHRRNRERSESVGLQDRLSRILSSERNLPLSKTPSNLAVPTESGPVVKLDDSPRSSTVLVGNGFNTPHNAEPTSDLKRALSEGRGSPKQPRPRSLSITMANGTSIPNDSRTGSPILLGPPIVSEPSVTFATTLQQRPETSAAWGFSTHRQYPKRTASGDNVIPRARTIHTGADVTSGFDGAGETSLASAKRWFSNLPTLLLSHRHSSPQVELQDEEPPEPEKESLPIRKKGEVDCLQYTTLDDAAMRKLEGRSDHRPIIWSGAVYI